MFLLKDLQNSTEEIRLWQLLPELRLEEEGTTATNIKEYNMMRKAILCYGIGSKNDVVDEIVGAKRTE